MGFKLTFDPKMHREYTWPHTYIKEKNKKTKKQFRRLFSAFSFFVALQKFVPLYMKILTVHGIQQCALYSAVSAWREVNVPFLYVC